MFFLFLITLSLSHSVLSQTDEYIQSGDNIIHFISYGEGQPILIINGGPGMSCKGFKYLANILGETHRAIIYDQRGTGQSKVSQIDENTITMDSMVKDIEVIRNHLNIDDWIVFGHSFGGMLGSYYAAQFPERISGLILSSSGGINLEPLSRISITSNLTDGGRDSLRYWNAQITSGDTSHFARLQKGKILAPVYLYDKSNVPIIAERLTQGNSRINQLVIQNMREIGFDCSKGLKNISVPVLIIQGEDDIIDRATAEAAVKVFENSNLIILEKCGHYGWLDQPELYFKFIHDYLEKLEG
jgi:proline iminopeptidase